MHVQTHQYEHRVRKIAHVRCEPAYTVICSSTSWLRLVYALFLLAGLVPVDESGNGHHFSPR